MPFLCFVVNNHKHTWRTQPQHVCEQTEQCEQIFTTNHTSRVTEPSTQNGPQLKPRGRESLKNYLEESQMSKEAKRF